ncbi:Rha family transcriptional regulator [Neisseria bacilliformis]|uniref:Rha family transcriptional regulator n=1 Tax=Neisseria bacilliformis TaxID=267212 RepID=UPI0028E28922|nr:Rha family transcriptional regulator [Neisseria bacilliformis]
MNAIINVQDFVQVKNSQTITTTEFVAQAFKKRHDHVLRNIDELLADLDPAFAAQNFRETETLRDNPLTGGKTKSRAYELTKDGFMLLVMGFTGKAALAIKIAYIQAFNAMAAALTGRLKTPEAKTTVDERTPLRQAVSALVGLRRVDYSTAYNMVHQRFGVGSIEDLPREVLPDAVRYVHALTLDNALSGEVLEKLERPSENITFSQSELRELAAVTYYCAWACRLLRDVAAPLAALGYEKAVTMRTLPAESAAFLRRVHKALLREMPKINSAFERADMQNSLNRCGFLM